MEGDAAANMAERCATSVGRFQDFMIFGNNKRRFLIIRVEININEVLCPGLLWDRKIRGPLWIGFKYERMPHFCYGCGLIGHETKECVSPILVDDDENELGPWMRAEFDGSERIFSSGEEGSDNEGDKAGRARNGGQQGGRGGGQTKAKEVGGIENIGDIDERNIQLRKCSNGGSSRSINEILMEINEEEKNKEGEDLTEGDDFSEGNLFEIQKLSRGDKGKEVVNGEGDNFKMKLAGKGNLNEESGPVQMILDQNKEWAVVGLRDEMDKGMEAKEKRTKVVIKRREQKSSGISNSSSGSLMYQRKKRARENFEGMNGRVMKAARKEDESIISKGVEDEDNEGERMGMEVEDVESRYTHCSSDVYRTAEAGNQPRRDQ